MAEETASERLMLLLIIYSQRLIKRQVSNCCTEADLCTILIKVKMRLGIMSLWQTFTSPTYSAYSALPWQCQWKDGWSKTFYKADEKMAENLQLQSRSCQLVLLYYYLFLAWLTRTCRSNVFYLLLPAETTRLCRQEAPVLSFVEVSQVLLLLSDACCESPEWAAARADSTLYWKDRSLFTTGPDTFTNY